jgi:hypothetical protein
VVLPLNANWQYPNSGRSGSAIYESLVARRVVVTSDLPLTQTRPTRVNVYLLAYSHIVAKPEHERITKNQSLPGRNQPRRFRHTKTPTATTALQIPTGDVNTDAS